MSFILLVNIFFMFFYSKKEQENLNGAVDPQSIHIITTL